MKVYFSLNTLEGKIEEVCTILSIERMGHLGRYLGVPTIWGRVTKATYQQVVERVKKRLADWKTKCLSLAGHITLIQLTIAAILSYTMQTSKLPRATCGELDRKVRRFLWGVTSLEHKPHLVFRDTITKPKKQVA